MKRVGLLFGSFNPLHNGHLAVAQKAQSEARLDQVLFIVQPENVYKPVFTFMDFPQRLASVHDALSNLEGFKAHSAEAADPAHFMRDTLRELTSPDTQLVLILGEDLARSLPDWPDYPEISKHAESYLSPRLDNVSSGLVRDLYATGQPIAHLVPEAVSHHLSS